MPSRKIIQYRALSEMKLHLIQENGKKPFIYITILKLQQGVRFDPDMPQTIRLEFAKSNTKGKTSKHP